MHPIASEASSFHTTRWTLVRQAQQPSPLGQQALADLCEAYYEPVVTFLRCELGNSESAREASHAFFVRILEGGKIQGAEPGSGRFRSYLLGAVKHFLAHEREAQSRLKRGGAERAVHLDDPSVAQVVDPQMSPDAAFERQWALTVLSRSLDALRLQCEAEGRGKLFASAQPHLNGDGVHGTQEAAAADCGLSLPAFRMALSRLRLKLRQHVKDEVAGTLESQEMIEEEMLALFAALSK